MGPSSEDGLVQIFQKQIDAVIHQMKDTREQLLQTEDRLETKIRNLLNDAETKEAKIVHLTKEIKELHEKIGNESVKGVTNDDEFKECMDVGDKSTHRFLDVIIENELAPNDTGQVNKKNGSPLDYGNIESERSIDLEGNPSQRPADDLNNNAPASHDIGRSNQAEGNSTDKSLRTSSMELYRTAEDLSSTQPFSQLSRKFSRLITSEDKNDMHTSESFHMYSAATISDPSNTCGKVWLLAITSALITMIQFLILNTLIIEASNPTCVTPQDCRLGEFCDYRTDTKWKYTPRCYDCSYVNDYAQTYNISNCTSVLDGHKDMSHTDYAVVDHIDIAWKVNFEYTDLEKFCFDQLHCSATDLLEDQCDYLVNHFNRLHPTQIGTLVFMSFLLAVLISRDVQDAVAEEKYLNHGLKCGSIKPSSQLAAEVLRMALRARQIVLPWFAAAAALSIISTDTLNAKNIMLNLLTIDIILIADDMLATLFLPLLDQTSTEKLIKSAAEHKVKVNMIWSRMHGILVATCLVVGVCVYEPLLIFFSRSSVTECEKHYWEFFSIFVFGPLIVTFLHGVGYMVVDSKRTTKCKAIMRGIGEMVLDFAPFAFYISVAPYVIIDSIYHDDFWFFKSLIMGITFLLSFLAYKVIRLYTSWQPLVR